MYSVDNGLRVDMLAVFYDVPDRQLAIVIICQCEVSKAS